MRDREHIFKEEGELFPGKTYVEAVLAPAFDQAKRELLPPMMAIHKAHLIMLKEQELVADADVNLIAAALQKIDLDDLRKAEYTGRFEDLFFQVEHELLEIAGDAAGNLHIARSRNDMGIAVYRMVLRDKLLKTIVAGLSLQISLIHTAEENRETLMIGYTHTQQAQPTTLAHYLVAVIDVLDRDIKRLQVAYANNNRSPMGAAALTTTGFNISRDRVRELLAFDELVENSYDAVAGVDYAGETAAAVQLAAINLGRFVQELLLWCTQEFDAIRVANPYVQVSSIMPQKRNPVSVEHARSLLSSIVGNAQTVLTMIHNTPFGDIVDTEDDMQPYLWKSLETLDQVYRLLAVVIGTLEVNKEKLRRRTEASFAVVTELADTLVRSEGYSFRTAHHVVGIVVSTAQTQALAASEISLGLVAEAAKAVSGKELLLQENELRRALDPEQFVRIRTHQGGPSPEEIARALHVRGARHAKQVRWTELVGEAVQGKLAALDAYIQQRSQNGNEQ
ncbi:argininosuccinate lyase [Paenibacillus sp. SYP-B3998]|uniref:Argininosuccinate lyase n=1 Tax=Paenibacillus sp. SYP-B3998 TaxID=2678564 RepID=A0A6G4A518_9BACL|nr:argininosuccinate lyase [Paenibacillus sp. SYP-B3998]NEW09485.1 argininosuccinate lyase [Paenibacillus sp. SYP-B3998]